jgi:myo-inositol 2-dehydrogenase/D-chiro-inositol 1-dehydrogenase
MTEPRICIVGAGSLSTKRIYPYVGAAGGMLVGVCDLEREKAERNARRWGGTVYAEMDAMLEAESPDAVIICIGPKQHAALAPAVLRRGIPVYTEKPPAPSAAKALEVARVAKETGVLCTTAFKKRYATAYTRAKEWIDSLPPDALQAISIVRGSGPYDNKDPRRDFLLDFEIHVIDLILYLMGDVVEAFAYTRAGHAWSIALRFASGALGSLSSADGRSFQVPTEEVEITAEGGHFMSVHNSSSWRITRAGKPTEWREPPTFTSAGDSGYDTGHLAELVDFVEAVRDGRTTRSNIAESYKSMVLYEAIRRSADEGRPVPVECEPI